MRAMAIVWRDGNLAWDRFSVTIPRIPRANGVDVLMILIQDLVCCLGLPKENCCRVGVGAGV